VIPIKRSKGERKCYFLFTMWSLLRDQKEKENVIFY